jgi:hypothetical protein
MSSVLFESFLKALQRYVLIPTLEVFLERLSISHDSREAVAQYNYARQQYLRHTTEPIIVTPLALANMCNYGEIHTDCSNQFI